MIRYIHICDVCKKEEETKDSYAPKTWKRLKISTDSYSPELIKYYIMCETCQRKMGILPKKEIPKEIIVDHRESVANKLYDVACEIVSIIQQEGR